MIATRSQVSAITERSCVISRSARPRSRRNSSSRCEDLPLRHHVERGRWLVTDHQLGPAGQGERDHHALAHAAGELVRVLPAPRGRDADALEQLVDAHIGIRAGLVQADRLGDLAVDPHHGVERVHRALEHHRRGPPAHVAPARRRPSVQEHHAALGVEHDLAARPAEAARQQSHAARAPSWSCRSRTRRPGRAPLRGAG